jgi:hypothetical protein
MQEQPSSSGEVIDAARNHYLEIYNRDKQAMYEFVFEHKDDTDYVTAFLDMYGINIRDTFNCYIKSSAQNFDAIRQFEHVADYRNLFTKMLVDIFGPAYQDHLSPVMITKLWDEAQDKLVRDYGARAA